jgi:hypothetical protein
MPLQMIESQDSEIVEVQLTGTLTDNDFRNLEPAFERIVNEHGKLRVLLRMLDFHGWDGHALWDELKFDAKHLGEIERLAVVGDRQWEKYLTTFGSVLTSAEVRYFDRDEAPQARAWLNGNSPGDR